MMSRNRSLKDPRPSGLTLANPNGGASLGLSSSLITVFDNDGPGTLVFTNTVYRVTKASATPSLRSSAWRSLGSIEVTCQTGGRQRDPRPAGTKRLQPPHFASGQTRTNFLVPLINTTTVKASRRWACS